MKEVITGIMFLGVPLAIARPTLDLGLDEANEIAQKLSYFTLPHIIVHKMYQSLSYLVLAVGLAAQCLLESTLSDRKLLISSQNLGQIWYLVTLNRRALN